MGEKAMENVQHAVEKFLAALRQRNASTNTITAYRKDLTKFQSYVTEKYAGQLSAMDHVAIRVFLANLYESGLSKPWVARTLAAVRSLYRWLGREKYVQHNPAALVATPRLPKKLPRVATIEEMNAIFEPNIQVEEKAAFTNRDRLIFELLYGCGVRNSERVGIDLGDIHFSNEVSLVRGKGRKERLWPLGEAAKDALTIYLKDRQQILSAKKKSTPALLINLRAGRLTTRSVGRIVKSLAVAGGLSPDIHPHTLRHAFGTHMLEEETDLRAIQEMLVHERASTTHRYNQLSLKHMMQAFVHTPPRSK